MPPIAICAFFNPFNSPRRRKAFSFHRRHFEHFGIRHLCVEQVFVGVPAVSGPDDITVTGGALIWQKECLLQLGIDQALKEGYDKIILCDADIIFETPGALRMIDSSFEEFDFFQPFETITMEYSDGDVNRNSAMSIALPRLYGCGHPGSCWAASRRFLERVRLYPYALLGGGDVVMTHLSSAALHHGPGSQRFRDLCVYFTNHVLYPMLADTLLSWAHQFEGNSFKLGHTANVKIRSLDHGSQRRRQYTERYLPWQGAYARNAPRPIIDFGVCPLGVLDWIAARDEWITATSEYLRSRDLKEG
jgi:hypothetical protein